MVQSDDRLTRLIAPTVEAMGYELVGVEYLGQSKSGALLRIYIDRPQGITLDDCARVSHQISGLLDVEDPIEGNYHLEVSSPGLDRPLFQKKDFVRFRGSSVTVKTRGKIEGRRRFNGELAGVQGEDVLVVVDGVMVSLPLNQIDKARLVPEF
ncbi:MAG: ribosome maturation factor RimP [Gammaproteobacteria bacterium]|nr:ribosome maturation factor RimP [Gammaproteobacteria bacterium]